jgi:hypothetical protein
LGWFGLHAHVVAPVLCGRIGVGVVLVVAIDVCGHGLGEIVEVGWRRAVIGVA